jgi:hypothetical protein
MDRTLDGRVLAGSTLVPPPPQAALKGTTAQMGDAHSDEAQPGRSAA